MNFQGIFIISTRYHTPEHIRELMIERMNAEHNIPIIVFHNQEELREMRTSNILLFGMANVLHLVMRHPFVGNLQKEIEITSISGIQTPCRPWFQKQKRHRKASISSGSKTLMKLKIPRGVYRDIHGRPEIQKPTPSRASRRNGSRK